MELREHLGFDYGAGKEEQQQKQ